ncbi:MAG: DNA-binding protein [Desulfobacteraceae bacterium]|nr:DNA-binding protein [Desulfobacteraceae bacterium]
MERAEYYTAKEIAAYAKAAEDPDCPRSPKGIVEKAEREAWISRNFQSRGRSGKSLEYWIGSVPEGVRAYIILAQNRAADTGAHAENRDELWTWYERQPDAKKETARSRADVCRRIFAYTEAGMKKGAAYSAAAQETGKDRSSLYTWTKKVKGLHRSDWLPVLCPRHKGRTKKEAELDHEAWEYFKSDYLSLKRPNLSTSYTHARDAAKEHGWKIPSQSTLKRKMEKEIHPLVIILKREGPDALFRTLPSVQRSREMYKAMEWINGDGYTHTKVWVKFPGGEVARPVTWFWQDVYSNCLLGRRTDISENADMIRLAFLDVADRYGIPEHITIDNTMAAASKWLTGRTSSRFRYKIRDDEPVGIFTRLGIQIHWTIPGRGQSKPVERTFSRMGGIREYIDKHPLFRSAYSKANAADLKIFLKARDDGMRRWNEIEKRRSEICAGKLSYRQAFDESYKDAEKRTVPESQRRYLMLCAEKVRVRDDGTFEMEAGKCFGKGKNRYKAEALFHFPRQDIIVYFDPQNLHDDVYCSHPDGRDICPARCMEKNAFGDTETSRKHERERNRKIKAVKDAAKAEDTLTDTELAGLLPGMPDHNPPEAKVIAPDFRARGNRKLTPEEERAMLEEAHRTIAFTREGKKEPDICIPETEVEVGESGLFGSLLHLDDEEKYDALMVIEASGTCLNENWQMFMRIFENSEEYRSKEDYYERKRLELARNRAGGRAVSQ